MSSTRVERDLAFSLLLFLWKKKKKRKSREKERERERENYPSSGERVETEVRLF